MKNHKKLTKKQKNMIKSHKKHKTKKYIKNMIKFMKQRNTFKLTHKKAKKKNKSKRKTGGIPGLVWGEQTRLAEAQARDVPEAARMEERTRLTKAQAKKIYEAMKSSEKASRNIFKEMIKPIEKRDQTLITQNEKVIEDSSNIIKEVVEDVGGERVMHDYTNNWSRKLAKEDKDA
jgi:hypothetical protein